MVGKLILVVGPTGSGKRVLVDHLRHAMPELIFPRSCTTRAPRPDYPEGHIYLFVSKEEFERRKNAGDFLEWSEYGGNLYGTLKDDILPHLAEGKAVVREVEVQGARQIQELVPKEQLRILFIDAGGWETLERRIRARAPITDTELLARRKRYEDEVTFKDQATVVVHNPDGKLEQAKIEFVAAVRELAA